MHTVGFSTGALALGDFRKALEILSTQSLHAVELSALRIQEVDPLLDAIQQLDLSSYSYVSFHAPSSYSKEEESDLVESLKRLPKAWPIIVHPDTIHDFSLWAYFGGQIAVENMDRRKPIGRTANELNIIFTKLPEASMCFDIGHARQYDSSMTEAYIILKNFAGRIVQVHLSEVDTSNRHHKVSFAAERAFHQVSKWLPVNIPLILESRVTEDQIRQEVVMAKRVFGLAEA